jgi:hypothetical protein
MLRLLTLGTLSLVIAVLTGSIPTPGAQPEKNATVAPGPLPAEILNAKTAFISNAGAECNPAGTVGFGGDADRAYNEFYAAIKAWGRYSLTAAPADADLALEISFACPPSGSNSVKEVNGNADSDPRFRLAIVDIKTREVLWVLIEHVRPALLQGNRDKNFDEAMAKLVGDAKSLGASSASSAAGGHQ